MKDLQTRIQQMLREKKNHSRVIALITALSLLMMFFVPYAGVMPGVALTNANMNDGKPYMDGEALTSAPSGAVNLANNINKAVFTAEGQTYTSTNGSAVNIKAGDADPAAIRIDMSYQFSKEELQAVLDSHFSTYQIATEVKLDNSYYGDTMIVTDADWSTTKVAGYYSISDLGLIVIHYTDDYLAYLSTSNGMKGTIGFNGSIARGSSAGGDVNFTFGKTNVTVEFDDAKPSMSKEGTPHNDGNGGYYIDWKITINNPSGYVDMSTYTLTDTLNGDAMDWNASNITKFSATPSGSVTTGADGKLTFTGTPEQIVVTYRQTGVKLGDTNTNHASLTNGTVTIPADFPVTVENGMNISKSGKPDYELGQGVNNKVQWTITLTHKNGDSLHKAVVTDEKASFGSIDNVTVYDRETGNAIDKSLYTVNGNTLTFADDTSIPSAVDIVFMGDVAYTETGSQSYQWFTNSATATRSDIPSPASTGDVGVTYQHELKFDKVLNGPNQEEGTLEWQFTLTVNEKSDNNGDGNSKETINGYKITDTAFANMTQEQINQIGFNVYYHTGGSDDKKGDQNSNSLLNVKITKDPNDANSVIITYDTTKSDVPLNKIKMYYKTTIQDSLSTDDWNTYNSGGTATLYNEATAYSPNNTVSDEGHDGKDIKQRIEANKSYNNANNNNSYSFGNEDTTDRILYWAVSLTKDGGFAKGDVYEDQLVTANSVAPHYIAPGQRDSSKFTIMGSPSSSTSKVTLDPSTYTLAFVDADGNEVGATDNAVGFVITFTEDVEALNYHYIDIQYESTAETSKIPNGTSVKFSNEYDFGGTHKSTDGMTYTRDNPGDVKKLNVGITKNWSDSQNAFGTRPETITIKVMQAEADDNGDLPDSPTWTEVNRYTFLASSSNASDNFSPDDEYPQWKYDQETGKVTQYYYKIEEVTDSGSGYSLDSISGPLTVQRSASQTGKLDFSLTNKTDQTFGKLAIDNDGNPVSQVSLSDVPTATITIDGKPTKCYMFKWKIVMNKGDHTSETYKDYLPDNAHYVTGAESGLSAEYHPMAYWSSTSYGDFYLYASAWSIGSYSLSDNVLTLNITSDVKWFTYYTAIPTSKISDTLEDGKLNNKISKGGKESTASVSVTGTSPDDDTDQLTKSFTKGVVGGYLNYTINVNPSGKKLSNTGTIDITDTLSYMGGDRTLDELDIDLYKINVYPLVNGEADTNSPLEAGTYSYTIDYDTEVSTEMKSSDWTKYDEDGKKWRTESLSPGDVLTLKLKYPADAHNQLNLYAKKDSGYSLDDVGNVQYNYDQLSQENGIVSVTLVVPPQDADVYELNDYQSSYEIQSATVRKSVPALLNISVPDQQPLCIEYIYEVTGWTTGNTLEFANTASFHADNGEGSWATDTHEMNTGSTATAEATRFPTIFKTDVGNLGMNYLSSQFLVAKYVPDTGWVYASKVETIDGEKPYRKFTFVTGENNQFVEAPNAATYPSVSGIAALKFAEEDDKSTTGDKENVHEFDLDEKTLYKFVEIVAPTDYRQPKWSEGYAGNQEFVYYYAYGNFEDDPPADAVGKVRNILKNSAINIPNSKNIDLSAEKSFSGVETNLPSSSEVELGLYWSTSKTGTGMKLVSKDDLDVPDDFVATQTIHYSTESNAVNNVTWENLPSGLHNGSTSTAIFYFVREESYTYNNVKYTYDEDTGLYKNPSKTENGPYKPVYTKNGTNTDGTVIEVTNSEGILVKKLWVDLDGKPVDPPHEVNSTTEKMKVPFTVYGIKSDGTKVELDLPEKELTATTDPKYTYVLPDELPGTDEQTYHQSDFVNYSISENLSDEQTISLYGRYLAPQTTRKISDGTGQLEIINTDITSPTTDAIVQKIWKDENVDHSEDTLQVMLVQSTHSDLTSAQLESIADGTSTLTGVYTGYNIRSTSQVKVIERGQSGIYTFTGKTIISAESTNAAVTAAYSGSQVTLTGNAVGSADIKVKFSDNTEEDFKATVIDYEVTIGAQGETAVWNYTWKNLPYTDGDTIYYYYVVEKSVPEDYTVSYKKTTTSTGQTTQITNSLPTKLTIQKEWYADGQKIDISNAAEYGLPDEISVNVYQKLKTETVGDTSQAKEKPTSLKIICFGDSITEGIVDNTNHTSNTYPVQLQGYLEGAEYSNVTVENKGISGNEILHLVDRLDNNLISFSGVDKMCLLIGTNDVLHNSERNGKQGEHGGYTNETDNVTFTNVPSEAPDRFEYLVQRIFRAAQEAGCSDFELYVGKIPYFTACDWIWDNNNPKAYSTQDVKKMVDDYNTAIANKVASLVSSGYNITMVDVCDAVKVMDANGNALATTMLSSDGCHPNDDGYDEIAKTFFTAINNKYLGGTVTTNTTPTDISMPGEDADISKQFSGTMIGTYTLQRSEGYKLSLDQLPEKNALGVEYVYYIKENGTHILSDDGTYYTLSGDKNQYIEAVTYLHNGQTAAESSTVTIRNTIKTAELSIVKIWDDKNTHTGDTITVRVHRETVADSDDAQQNPLTLAMSVENGSTIQLPIGNTDGIEITSNKGVNPTVTGSGIATPTTDTASKKVWKIRPAGNAEVGDTATVTFTDESGQKVTVNIEIVDNPKLSLAPNTATFTANANDPTLSPSWTIQYTPSGGSPQSLNAEDANVTFTSSNPSAATINDNGVLTVVNGGTTNITATYNNDGILTSNKVEVTINLPAFTLSAENAETSVKENGSINLIVNPIYGDFDYSYTSNDGGEVTLQKTACGVKVNGKTVGNVIIYANRKNGNGDDIGNQSINITVTQSASVDTFGPDTLSAHTEKTYSVDITKKVSKVEVEFNISKTNQYNNPYIDFELKYDGNRVRYCGIVNDGSSYSFMYSTVEPTINNNTYIFSFDEATSIDTISIKPTNDCGTYEVSKITVTYSSDLINSNTNYVVNSSRQLQTRFSSNTLHLSAARNYTSQPLAAAAEIEEQPTPITAAFNDSGYMDITMTSANSWQKQLTGLPVYKVNTDGTLQSYYYWAEEIEVNGKPVAGYTVSYSFTDGDSETDYSINAANPGANPLITIKNTPTESPSSVELPESGSTGTKIYYLTGGILLLLSAAGYITYTKRRRWFNE